MPEAGPQLDFKACQPKSPGETEKRIRLFTEFVVIDCQAFLVEHMQKLPQGKRAQQEQDSALKELAITFVYLVALEQISDGAPDWLKDFLFGALSSLDQQLPGKSMDSILSSHQSSDREKICIKATANICETLKSGELGDPNWARVEKFLKQGGTDRTAFLQQALQADLQASV